MERIFPVLLKVARKAEANQVAVDIFCECGHEWDDHDVEIDHHACEKHFIEPTYKCLMPDCKCEHFARKFTEEQWDRIQSQMRAGYRDFTVAQLIEYWQGICTGCMYCKGADSTCWACEGTNYMKPGLFWGSAYELDGDPMVRIGVEGHDIFVKKSVSDPALKFLDERYATKSYKLKQ